MASYPCLDALERLLRHTSCTRAVDARIATNALDT